MKAGKMLLGGVAGFGMGLARVMKNAKEEDKANWPQWMKDISGYKPKTVPPPEAPKSVAAITDKAPVLPKAEEVKTPSVGPETPGTPAGNDYADQWLSGEGMSGADGMASEVNDYPMTPAPDGGLSADVVTTPLPETDYAQSSADIGMSDYPKFNDTSGMSFAA